jgi:DNA-binding transcriptional ArsR family regulator
MRTKAPSLLPIFRSQHQGKLLARLLLNPGTEYTITELARDLDLPKQTVQGEIQRLIDAHLLYDRRQGRNRLVSANPDHPASAPLTQLALLTFGPHDIIADEFSTITGADRVLIFGSWAARYAGQPGPPPNDIDVLVIGQTSRLELFEAADRAQRRIGTEVNPERCAPEQWDSPSDSPLLIEIQQRPCITVYPRQVAAA